jgi:hypothetical protein
MKHRLRTPASIFFGPLASAVAAAQDAPDPLGAAAGSGAADAEDKPNILIPLADYPPVQKASLIDFGQLIEQMQAGQQ